MGTPSGFFVSQWHKKHAQLHTFYTNTHLLIPAVTFYGAKLQSVKTPVAAKPSRISPNHPCQCSLVILSYYISPFHCMQITFKNIQELKITIALSPNWIKHKIIQTALTLTLVLLSILCSISFYNTLWSMSELYTSD